MKKISLLTLGCMAVASVMAQDTQSSTTGTKDFKPVRTEMARKVRFGLQGGINIAKFAVTDVPGYDVTGKTSIYGGAFVNIPIGPLRIQPGVMWNGLGSKYTQTFTTVGTGGTTVSSTHAFQQNLNYITVPVMFQLMPGHNGFFIEAGPYASFLVNAKYEDQTSGATQPSNSDNKADFDKTDFGAIGGIGYETRIGLGFTASYLNGFTNVIKDDNAASNSGQKLRNRAWRFGLIYHFGAAK
ncbi:PorT family protein [Flaviaesturariibacter flavus]|uniref:PorT family protein n=1 Tax=Flaviaesturariibacter flavus TaxID=2502780 RepID=A0A4V6NB39_9BACT|nr:porin family protein [Flaviaesturariibacter flavus]TCJ18992.1 PorT family protein [Flaviaesturariibacter flavus]